MKIKFRKATISDADLYFSWLNDPEVRNNSYQADPVPYETHLAWFTKRLNADSTFFYLFINEKNIPVGQVRIERQQQETIIGISIDKNFRGMGLGSEMLNKATDDFLSKYPQDQIHAYIKLSNPSSYRIFKKAGFEELGKENISGVESYKLIKNKHEGHHYR